MFGVTVATLGLWARQGKLNAMRTPGGHRRYRRAEILPLYKTENKAQNEAAQPDPKELDMARLYDQGWSIRRVAAAFAQDYSTTRRILRQHTTLRDR